MRYIIAVIGLITLTSCVNVSSLVDLDNCKRSCRPGIYTGAIRTKDGVKCVCTDVGDFFNEQ